MSDTDDQFSIISSASLRYLLALPTAAPSETPPQPVICFLHGYDEGAPTEIVEGLTRHGPLRNGNRLLIPEPSIVVAPQLPDRGDIWHRFADDVLRIVQEVQQKFNGDARRTYLTGFSFGGNGVFDLGLLQPDHWAALWAVDPPRIPLRDSGLPILLSFGAVARFRKEAFIRELALQPMEGAGGQDHRLYTDDGADHVGSARLAYEDRRNYVWLLSKRLANV